MELIFGGHNQRFEPRLHNGFFGVLKTEALDLPKALFFIVARLLVYIHQEDLDTRQFPVAGAALPEDVGPNGFVAYVPGKSAFFKGFLRGGLGRT